MLNLHSEKSTLSRLFSPVEEKSVANKQFFSVLYLVNALLESVYTLYEKLATLKGIAEPELLLPGETRSHKDVVVDAYTAYANVETTVDALGQALEEERKRLDKTV